MKISHEHCVLATSTQQCPSELLCAPAPKAMPVFDFQAEIEFAVGTTQNADFDKGKVYRILCNLVANKVIWAVVSRIDS